LRNNYSLLLGVTHENDQEPLKKNDGIEVNTKALIDGIPCRLSLRIMDDLLHIIEGEGTKKYKTTVEPNVEESWAWEEHLHK